MGKVIYIALFSFSHLISILLDKITINSHYSGIELYKNMTKVINMNHTSNWGNERGNKFVKEINSNGKNDCFFKIFHEEERKILTPCEDYDIKKFNYNTKDDIFHIDTEELNIIKSWGNLYFIWLLKTLRIRNKR